MHKETTIPYALPQRPAHYDRWFYTFLCLHLLCWTIVPTLVRYNLPLDSMEGTMWGQHLQWGYDKNPFFYAWMSALATHLDLNRYPDSAVYLFSQLSVIVCFIAIWQLAKKMLPAAYAIIAVMVLEGIQYYHIHAIDFSDNTLELSLWALTIYFFYQALTHPNKRVWILTGIFAGLGMMTKYYIAMLLIGMVLFFVIHPTNRQQCKTLPPYLCLMAFLLIITPHVIWLFHHDFITVRYAYQRGSSGLGLAAHFIYPAQFAWQQLQALLPACVLYALLFIGKRPLVASNPVKLNTFNQRFLFFVGLGPLLYTLFISLLLGTKLRSGWAMPLLSTYGIILVALIQPVLTKHRLYQFIASVYLLIVVLISVYSISLIFPTTKTTANFPGREIADAITERWHATYHRQLEYVAGSRWLCGNISLYSPDHPSVYVEWNQQKSLWIDLAELHKKGGVFVWEQDVDWPLFKRIQHEFPSLQKTQVMTFAWHRANANASLSPTQISVALLPPLEVTPHLPVLAGTLSKNFLPMSSSRGQPPSSSRGLH